jgi:hypothetical protein
MPFSSQAITLSQPGTVKKRGDRVKIIKRFSVCLRVRIIFKAFFKE